MLSDRGAVAAAPSGRAHDRRSAFVYLLFAATWPAALVLPPTASFAESPSDAPPDCRAAIVGLNADTRSADTLDRAAQLVAEAGCEPVGPDTLRDALDDHRADEVAADTSDAFTDLPRDVGAGLEHFFYKSSEGALQKLAPLFELGRQHPRVLGGRPDYADQLWQAGVVLVRIHLQNDRRDQAKTVARQLVELFPPREPNPKNVPPKARELIQNHRNQLADTDTRLQVTPAHPDACETYVNGVAAPDGPAPVAPSRPYFVLTDCGSSGGAVWRLSPQQGSTRSYVLPGTDPTRLATTTFDRASRSAAVRRTASLFSLTDVDHVVGIASSDTAPHPAVMHVDTDDEAAWASVDEPQPLRAALREAWPERAARAGDAWRTPPADSSADTGGRDPDVVGWALTAGGGAVALGGLGYYLFGVRPRARVLDCSPNTGTYRPASSRCDGVAAREFTHTEVERTERQLATRRTLSFVALGVGTAAAGYGLYRLLTHPRPDDTSDQSTALRLAIDPTHPRATVRFRFP